MRRLPAALDHLQRERHRDVLRDRGAFEQDGTVAHDPKSIERCEPVIAACDVVRALAEDPHLSAIRQTRTGDQADDHFRHAAIHAHDRDTFPAGNLQSSETERAQRVIALLDINNSQDR